MVKGSGRGGRVLFRADDPSLTAHAGLELEGELVRRIGLVDRIDHAIAGVRWSGPGKQRQRGLRPGELVVSVAESILCGAECWDDLEELRSDGASAGLRAVAAAPAASTARQRAARYRRSHLQAIERAAADAGAWLDEEAGVPVGEAVTIDLDGTDIEVHGRKQGAKRGRGGMIGYTAHVATWAERGRALTGELYGANQAVISSSEALKLARRAISLLPAGHGPVTVRIDAGYAGVELLDGLRRLDATFSVSLRRTSAMWRVLDELGEDAWHDAINMHKAQVAETMYSPTGWKHEPLRLLVRRVRVSALDLLATAPQARRRRTIPPGQIQLALAGELSEVYAYSFILTDLEGDLTVVEMHHRQRAQIEDRFKEAKLGQAMRHMPCKNINQNRFWMTACLLALNITSLLSDMTPLCASTEDEHGTRSESPRDRIRTDPPVRRSIKTVRRWILDLPGRIVRTGRRTIMRLPAGYRHLTTLTATYDAILTLPHAPTPTPM
jgi:hypothetical protein